MKNTKPRPHEIKYDPVRQEKKPLWMHSVEGPRTHVSESRIFAALGVVIIFVVFIIYLVC